MTQSVKSFSRYCGEAGGSFCGMSTVPITTRLLTETEPKDRKELARLYEKHTFAGCGKSLACRDVCPRGIDTERLQRAVEVANVEDFVESLPLGFSTKVGMEGNGVSQGQRQRLLIARAVYKDPQYLFFDEATNALDTNNERIIMEHLREFYRGRTVVIVAHRLSTVRDADNIIVLDHGKMVEQGTHEELTALKGVYFKLVKNQLELGK